MSGNKFTQQTEILNTLVSESIKCTPESWTSGTLTISCDGSAINYSLKNKNEEEKAQITDQLRSCCEQLYVAMRDQGDVWLEAIIEFNQSKDEEWSFNSNFKYPEENETTSNSKPWWKFW